MAGKTIVVASGKGGTGKSTFACSLALSLEKENKKVLIIDLDEGLRCLDIFFGIDKDIVLDLSDVLSGNSSDAVYTIPNHRNISLIPAPDTVGKINARQFAAFLEKEEPKYDVIILDFPAGLDFSIVKQVNFPINPDPVSVRDASVVCDSINGNEIEPRLILNRFDIELIKGGFYKNIDDIIDISGLRLIGIVPNDTELLLLPVSHALRKNGRADKAMHRIAGRILGRDIPLPKPKKI